LYWSILSVLRVSVVIKAPEKPFHHGDTENTEKPVGREVKTLRGGGSNFTKKNILRSSLGVE
jgi:hypothetical protein